MSGFSCSSLCECWSPILRTHARTAGAIILKVTYGYGIQADEDPFVELANRAMANVSLVTTPGAFLVDLIPARTNKSCLRLEHTLK